MIRCKGKVRWILVPATKGSASQDGLVDGAPLKSSPEEKEGDGRKKQVCSPSRHCRCDLPRISKGEERLGAEKHRAYQEGSDGYSPRGAPPCECNAKGS